MSRRFLHCETSTPYSHFQDVNLDSALSKFALRGLQGDLLSPFVLYTLLHYDRVIQAQKKTYQYRLVFTIADGAEMEAVLCRQCAFVQRYLINRSIIVDFSLAC